MTCKILVKFQNKRGKQDKNPLITIAEDGSELELEGNGWKKVALDYNITGNTILEFEFRSTAEGEVQGIGFDTDDKLSGNRFFKLYGTQNWGITNYEDYSAGAHWKSYQIPVGQFFTGEMDFLTFGNDHDVQNPTASSEFRNLKLYDIPIHPLAVTVNETTATYWIDSYGGNQDKNPFITIPTDGSELKLEGNGWKKVALDYNITGNTMLEFEFRSTAEGEVQGIGFDTDDRLSRNRFFKLYGTQNWGITNYENYSSGDEWKSYLIPVGDFFTGEIDFLTFGNNHDVRNPTASSEFRNLRLYEDSALLTHSTNDELVEIVGSSENDFITGTKAGDIIIGLEAEDTLTCGLGSDQFVYNRLADAGDVITDFEVGNDQIVLTELFAHLDYHGSDAMVDGYIQLVQENSGVGVNIDPDGLNGQESFIPLTFVEGVSLAELNDSSNFLY